MNLKNNVATALAVLAISGSAVAQKDELKTLKKIYDKEAPSDKDMNEYKSAIAAAEGKLAGAGESDKVYINFYKAMTPILDYNLVMSKPENQSNPMLGLKYINTQNIGNLSTALPAVLAFEKTAPRKLYTTDIEETITSFTPAFLNYAVALEGQKNYKEAAAVLYSIYTLDKKKADNLYYAATYAVTAKDYDLALKYYDELKSLNYSGEGTVFYAKNIATDQEEGFATKADRDKMLAMKTHIGAREEKLPSKRGEIYKNYALILVEKGRIDEAKAALAEAKAQNPDDISLILTEADMYLTLKDTETYQKLITQALEKNPNDADLVYNLGVVSLQAEKLADAEKYFNRAIEINPKYVNAYINLAAIKLKGDKKLVDEMNKLGNTEKDNKRYDQLKKERTALFTSAMVPLEKAYALDANNELILDNLLSVYSFLNMTEKHKALKDKRK